MSINREKTEKEIKGIEEKVRELNRRKKALKQKLINAENEELLDTIRSLDLTKEELTEFLYEFAGKDEVPDKPKTQEKVQDTGKDGRHEK